VERFATHHGLPSRRCLIAALALALCAVGAARGQQGGPSNYAAPGKETYLKFAEEAELMLRRDVLGVWFPRTVDTEHGGFHSNFTRDWKKSPGDGSSPSSRAA